MKDKLRQHTILHIRWPHISKQNTH